MVWMARPHLQFADEWGNRKRARMQWVVNIPTMRETSG
jgi:hypothetical protein